MFRQAAPGLPHRAGDSGRADVPLPASFATRRGYGNRFGLPFHTPLPSNRHRTDTGPPGWKKVSLASGDRATAVIEGARSEEHTSELQSLMRISYDVFSLKKKKNNKK